MRQNTILLKDGTVSTDGTENMDKKYILVLDDPYDDEESDDETKEKVKFWFKKIIKEKHCKNSKNS